MKIYIVVEREDVEVFNCYGETDYITTTEVISAYGTLQEARCEAQWLNSKNVRESVVYDVEQTELN